MLTFVGLMRSNTADGDDSSEFITAVIVKAKDFDEAMEKVETYAREHDAVTEQCHEGLYCYKAVVI